MQLGTHEAMDLHELTLSCVNSITNMAYCMDHEVVDSMMQPTGMMQ